MAQVAFNLDDGFEFFGGTVNVDHLSSLFVGDDAFDADAGYQGRGQFLFTLIGDHGDHGMEIDAFNGSAPCSHPVFYSITAVGAPTVASHDRPLILTRNGAAGQYGNAVLAFGSGAGAQVGSCNLDSIVQSLPSAAAGGVGHERRVLEIHVASVATSSLVRVLVAGRNAQRRPAVPRKPVPLTTIVVPPAAGPERGARLSSVTGFVNR